MFMRCYMLESAYDENKRRYTPSFDLTRETAASDGERLPEYRKPETESHHSDLTQILRIKSCFSYFPKLLESWRVTQGIFAYDILMWRRNTGQVEERERVPDRRMPL